MRSANLMTTLRKSLTIANNMRRILSICSVVALPLRIARKWRISFILTMLEIIFEISRSKSSGISSRRIILVSTKGSNNAAHRLLISILSVDKISTISIAFWKQWICSGAPALFSKQKSQTSLNFL